MDRRRSGGEVRRRVARRAVLADAAVGHPACAGARPFPWRRALSDARRPRHRHAGTVIVASARGLPVTLPTPEGGGFSPPAIRRANYLPRVLRTYLASLAGWPEYLEHHCATPRTVGCATCTGPKPTKHGF